MRKPLMMMHHTKTYLQCFIGDANIRTFHFVAVVAVVTLVADVALVAETTGGI